MKAIDTRGSISLPDSAIIPNDELLSLCKINNGATTCRYIFFLGNRYYCAKCTKLRTTIDELMKNGKMVSKGDHCPGKSGKIGKGDKDEG